MGAMLRRVVERSGSATRRLVRERDGPVAGRRFQQPRRGFAADFKVNWGCYIVWHQVWIFRVFQGFEWSAIIRKHFSHAI